MTSRLLSISFTIPRKSIIIINKYNKARCNNIHSSPRICQAIDKVAENKINEWIRKGGADGLKGKNIDDDKNSNNSKHKVLARSMGIGNDYIHSKILADNNIKPDSVQRRIELDTKWDKVKLAIQEAYYGNNNSSHSNQNMTTTPPPTTASSRSVEDFVFDEQTRTKFEDDINELDRMAKRCNDAILSDSLRFNGRAPVKHARRFVFEERIREAILDST